ncbi:NhaA family Na+:H+ antiporter [Flavobacterium gossypii]|uniref:Na(+)/H(+) antiporter NhaA n=1 Tax=Flavobacterium gossypii TaxID=1646119 RepID=A0ABR6DTS1_9FLAO|nr:Na+/H+ antiporter NhaA [Flavobacterium gossypii]MBA9075082.1 NhaA family Na+:H+ antiporter [Flavobacterium gossypii]
MDDQLKATPAEKWIINPLNNFISKSTTGGIILFLAAVVAVFLANSPLKDWYHHIWEHKIGLTINDELYLNYTIHHWVNDGLMAIFFFVVGLELKREIIGGELSQPKKAMLPIVAAIGGMVFPALIYTLFNFGTDSAHGWGIPMATDIAFALGVLYLLGDRIPATLKIFLTALAIVDDLGAVLVIAFFYTAAINFIALGIGLGVLLFLFVCNRFGIRNILFYAIIGIAGVWLPFLLSGVHATIAAVLVAFVIPAGSRIDENLFISKIKTRLNQFKELDPTDSPVLSEDQLHVLQDMRKLSKDAMSPLHRLEHGLHPFVSFIIMPVFALANAGVTFSSGIIESAASNVTLGVVFGLLAGKVIGVYGVSALLIKMKLASLPDGLTSKSLFGVGFLASIGFTMSLFVTNLAFHNPEYELQAKLGIFAASLIGGILGYVLLVKKNTKISITNS